MTINQIRLQLSLRWLDLYIYQKDYIGKSGIINNETSPDVLQNSIWKTAQRMNGEEDLWL